MVKITALAGAVNTFSQRM